MPQAKRKWTAEERALLLAMRDAQKLPWDQIAKAFDGSTAHSCSSQWCNLKAGHNGTDRTQHKRRSNAEFVTEALLADSARRKALRLSRSDVGAQLLGDPLPGQSALDQRGAAETVKADRRRVDGMRGPRPTLYWGKCDPERVRP